ncbi:hypothetical protein [Gracilibacillus alcaliphilus]|nr:hypothetical protein [Gracilibacillus alcaliphilus]
MFLLMDLLLFLPKTNLKMRKTAIEKLLFAAKESVSKPLEQLSRELFLLKQKLKAYDWHNQNIALYNKEIPLPSNRGISFTHRL